MTTEEDLRDSFPNKLFLEGNAATLTKYFQNILSKSDLKVAYFGDQLHSDVWATHHFDKKLREGGSEASWDAIAVIDELY